MVMLVLDREFEERTRAQRRAMGLDDRDEVWDGVYVMSPLADIEHQNLVGGLTTVLTVVIVWPGMGSVQPGTNVSDRDEDWVDNYRIPDVAVFLNGTTAIHLGTHWLGGPDFTVEVLSNQDRARQKLPFYASLGVREVLMVDRDSWALELYRLADGRLDPVGRSTLDQPHLLSSEVVPLSFRLAAGEPRPAIEVSHADGQRRWTI